MLFTTSTVFSVLIAVSSVASQSVITSVEGAPGKTGAGFGVTDPTGKKTPLAKQFSQYRTAKESGCGFANGELSKVVNTRADITKAIAAGLPAPDASGKLTVTMDVISSTGAGYVFSISRSKNLINSLYLIDHTFAKSDLTRLSLAKAHSNPPSRPSRTFPRLGLAHKNSCCKCLPVLNALDRARVA